MKTINLNVPDQLYDTLSRAAAVRGHAATHVLVAAIKDRFRRAPTKSVNLHRHFGAWQSGNPKSADNDSLDADLRRSVMEND